MLTYSLLLICLGLAGLWIGSELVVKGATIIAKRMGLSETFIGLTILSFGTNFPEIMVTLTGAVQTLQGIDTTDLVVGNIIGSSMSQISLVLGLAGLLRIFKIKRKEIISNGLMLIASTLLLFFLAIDGTISLSDGLVMVLFYVAYFFSLRKTTGISKIKGHIRRFLHPQSVTPVLQLLIGFLIIVKSSDLVLDHGVILAEINGVNQMIIGIFLIGLGTSLPEFVVSVSAAIKGSGDLSIGNLIGSNIVGVLVALGGSAFISNWSIQRSMATFDIPYLLFTSVVVVLFLLTKQKLERKESLLILSLYAVYAALKMMGF
jgi:cation:H+ antiporter